MSKIGVGVGDDFPVDDGGNRADPPRDDRAEFEAWKRRRDAHRAQREAWRRRRAEWKAQWREQRRALHDAWHENNGDAFSRGRYRRGYPYFGGHQVMKLIMIAGVIALVVFALMHIGYIIVGLLALAVLFAAYHRFGHDPLDFDFADRRYSRPMTTPPPAPTPSVEQPRGPEGTP
jgi:hypothetical protein